MSNPFDLAQPMAYQRWRDAKLASQPHQASDLIVDVADPRALSASEREALLQRCDVANMAIYRSPVLIEDKAIPIQLARQLGLHQLDGNWLADEDGISQQARVSAPPLSPTPTARSSGIPMVITTPRPARSGPWCCTACALRAKAAIPH
jgi:hypothetical protein